ncbi:hypothetical protein GGX14DRAFT_395757 [Mycena pura]|uniref:Uncharacterized protein n=1 Tax=Mycena pura TaxID=153505 RepID=A0AAD6VFV2_9AGAR|nr:hypothetical protein GGX14DRAFT_395757 [Mycena pura]
MRANRLSPCAPHAHALPASLATREGPSGGLRNLRGLQPPPPSRGSRLQAQVTRVAMSSRELLARLGKAPCFGSFAETFVLMPPSREASIRGGLGPDATRPLAILVTATPSKPQISGIVLPGRTIALAGALADRWPWVTCASDLSKMINRYSENVQQIKYIAVSRFFGASLDINVAHERVEYVDGGVNICGSCSPVVRWDYPAAARQAHLAMISLDDNTVITLCCARDWSGGGSRRSVRNPSALLQTRSSSHFAYMLLVVCWGDPTVFVKLAWSSLVVPVFMGINILRGRIRIYTLTDLLSPEIWASRGVADRRQCAWSRSLACTVRSCACTVPFTLRTPLACERREVSSGQQQVSGHPVASGRRVAGSKQRWQVAGAGRERRRHAAGSQQLRRAAGNKQRGTGGN